MANSYKQELAAIKAEISAIVLQMEKWDQAIIQNSNNAAGSGKKYTASLKDTNALIQKSIEVQKTMSAQLGNQAKETEKLVQKKKQYNALIEMGIQKEKARKAEIKLTIAATTNYAGAYAKLIAKQKLAKKTLQDLIASEKKNVVQVKKAQREYDKYTKRVNKAKQATSNFAKTGLGSMVRGFKNLLGAFGIVGGVMALAAFTKSVFSTVKEIEKLQFALSTVTKTQDDARKSTEDFIRVNAFLLDISKRYGAELVSTTERYTKFLAATKQSNLSMTDTENIFESVTKAAGVLGLRTDELTGVYLALEQMISKGKITTEELRRQLGERLPGAMGIMAKAVDKLNPNMNVTISVLDKMLKKGEVISAEVLPEFARQLEKAYGIEQVENVETLVAAQNKLTTSWTEFVMRFEKGEGKISAGFKKMFGWATDLVEVLISANRTNLEIGQDVQNFNFIQSLRTETDLLRKDSELFGKTIEEVAQENLPRYKKEVEDAQAALDDLNKQYADNEEFLRVNNIAVEDSGVNIEDLSRKIIHANGVLGDKRGRLEAVNSILHENTEIIDENTEATKRANKERKAEVDYLGTTIQERKEREKIVKAIEDALNGTELLYKMGGKDVPNGVLELGIEGLEKGNIDEMNQALTIMAEKLRDVGEAGKMSGEQLTEIYRTVTAAFSEYYDIDFEKFTFLMDGKTNSVAEWADAAVEASNVILEASLRKYEIELQEAQRARDLIINNDLATEKEKRIARQKFEREERDIKTRRAKAERNNTIIQIAVDTAAGIAKTLATVGLPAGFPLVATLTGIGLAQAAIVAAQPLPKFAEGTKGALSKDTMAIVGDGGRQEVLTKNGKVIGLTPDKPTLANLERGTEVHKSIPDFLSNSDIMKEVFNMNMALDGRNLTGAALYGVSDEIGRLRSDNKQLWGEIKKIAKRPIHVDNRVVIEQEYKEYR